MKFVNVLVSSFEGSFLLLIVLIVTTLSVNIFALHYNASHGNKEAFLLHLIFVFVIVLVMFLANYAGQQIINYCNHIYITAYNVRWYEAPLHAQKMILFILLQGNKSFTINIAGMFVISLECFAMLTKASMSYFTVLHTTQQVKNLLEQLQYICNNLKDKNEIDTILKYGNNAKHCTAIITLISICSTFFATLLPIWPQISNTVLNVNESRLQSHTVYIVTEYFIDKKKYSYLILLHANVTICIGGTTVIATGTMILACIIYACGMFKIASYRMEQIMSTKMLENINLTKNQTMIYKKIYYAVEIHRKAMKFTNTMLSNFEGSFILIITFSVISLSLNIFAIFRNVSFGNKEAALLHLLIVFLIFIYIFIANYAGQEITNHSNHIYSTAYNIRWYKAPSRIQKIILIILQRGSKSFNLNIAGLFVLSVECFATLTKTSLSYFTVIYSTQQSYEDTSYNRP
ncbi:uncharacterized protein LOC109610618 [Camponotus floridanus]|uniref:uncharacterized protein LOC109610618 n=1 Tax=Camponotus floridanus TaxID=104421 RepID=UPI000DC6AB8D|nr:uncharacterized protein LOC109610618 [Camponotus floridanus]